MTMLKYVLLGFAALIVAIGPAAARQINLTTKAGKPVVVIFEGSWDKDCKSTGGPSYTTQSGPSNGATSVRAADKIIKTCDAGQCGCLGRTVTARQLVYTPRPGFKGTEQFDLVSKFPNNREFRHSVKIEVK